jgi:apolipoprotein N-acyltransferase
MKPHRTDGLSLTFGLIFLGIVIVWLFNAVLDLKIREPGWIVAGALILFGLLGLFGALRSESRRGPKQENESDEL